MIEKILIWLLDRWQTRDSLRTLGAKRSPMWQKARNAYAKENPLCAVCGDKSIEIHHEKPFHLYPDLELNPLNFISLCRPHHYVFGHLMSWSSFNDKVREDSKLWNIRIINRPK